MKLTLEEIFNMQSLKLSLTSCYCDGYLKVTFFKSSVGILSSFLLEQCSSCIEIIKILTNLIFVSNKFQHVRINRSCTKAI